MRFQLLALFLSVLMLSGMTHSAPVPAEMLTDNVLVDAPEQGPANSLIPFDDMVIVALSLIGTPYKYGGVSPETGFDCSGLVKYVLGLSSTVTLPRTSADMYRMGGKDVPLDDMVPGDLVFFKVKSKRINHVAVYIGEGRFVHAPSTGNFVRVDILGKNYWQRYIAGARRVIPEMVASRP
ncbi:MAG TPA: C40 family peptidase [Moraxellaceae bacterium]|jgi:cell wall-associated NlpC family hydrolase|nr:C40 family peptidase [Moraxellaceae bacterium]